MIWVLIAEDQGLVRGALASLIALEPDIEVVAQVSRGDEVVPAAVDSRPDVALLDIEMPGATGLDAAGEMRRELPGGRARRRFRPGRGGPERGGEPPDRARARGPGPLTPARDRR